MEIGLEVSITLAFEILLPFKMLKDFFMHKRKDSLAFFFFGVALGPLRREKFGSD